MATPPPPAVDFRVALNQLLQEHLYLASFATDAAIGGRTDEFGAAGAALNTNGTDLGAAIGGLFGQEAQDEWNRIWSAHNGFFVDYTTGVATDDMAMQDQAVEDLTDGLRPRVRRIPGRSHRAARGRAGGAHHRARAHHQGDRRCPGQRRRGGGGRRPTVRRRCTCACSATRSPRPSWPRSRRASSSSPLRGRSGMPGPPSHRIRRMNRCGPGSCSRAACWPRAASPAGAPAASDSPPAAADLTINLADFMIDPSDVEAAGPTVTVEVTSDGPTPHNLTVRDADGTVLMATEDLSAGDTETISASSSRASTRSSARWLATRASG